MSQSERRLSVGIVGGGLAGAALANALVQHNHLGIHVFESAPEFSERGAAIGLSVNALKALDHVVPNSEAMLQRAGAVEMNSSRIMVGSGPHAGAQVFDLAGLEPVRGRVLHRASLLRELLAPLPRDVLHANKKLTSVAPEEDGSVTLTFEDGKSQTFDAVIGADGIFSSVRNHVLGPDAKSHAATPAGYWDIRTLVSMDRAKEVLGEDLFQLDRQYGWLGDGAFLMHDILENRSMVQFVITAVEKESPKDRKTSLTRELLENTLRSWPDKPVASGAIQLSLDGREDPAYAWSLWEHKTTPTYAKDRVCIIGDAAHATTPWQGAGAGQALEDAMVLGALFGQIQDPEDIGVLFKAFDAVRRPRAQRIVESSQGTGAIMCGQSAELGLDPEKLAAGLAPRWSFIMELEMPDHKQEAIFKFKELKEA